MIAFKFLSKITCIARIFDFISTTWSEKGKVTKTPNPSRGIFIIQAEPGLQPKLQELVHLFRNQDTQATADTTECDMDILTLLKSARMPWMEQGFSICQRRRSRQMSNNFCHFLDFLHGLASLSPYKNSIEFANRF